MTALPQTIENFAIVPHPRRPLVLITLPVALPESAAEGVTAVLSGQSLDLVLARGDHRFRLTVQDDSSLAALQGAEQVVVDHAAGDLEAPLVVSLA